MAAPVEGENLQLPIDPPPPGGWGGNPANAKKFPTDPKSDPSQTIRNHVRCSASVTKVGCRESGGEFFQGGARNTANSLSRQIITKQWIAP
jgi:hypothetical protein